MGFNLKAEKNTCSPNYSLLLLRSTCSQSRTSTLDILHPLPRDTRMLSASPPLCLPSVSKSRRPNIPSPRSYSVADFPCSHVKSAKSRGSDEKVRFERNTRAESVIHIRGGTFERQGMTYRVPRRMSFPVISVLHSTLSLSLSPVDARNNF